MSQHLDVRFRVLFLSEGLTVVAGSTTQRGSDIVRPMKGAFANASRVAGAPPGWRERPVLSRSDTGTLERRLLPDTRVTAFPLAVCCQAQLTGP